MTRGKAPQTVSRRDGRDRSYTGFYLTGIRKSQTVGRVSAVSVMLLDGLKRDNEAAGEVNRSPF